MKVTGEMIREQGAALHSYPIVPDRAAELARELEILGASVEAAAQRLEIDDEPSRYRAILTRNLPRA